MLVVSSLWAIKVKGGNEQLNRYVDNLAWTPGEWMNIVYTKFNWQNFYHGPSWTSCQSAARLYNTMFSVGFNYPRINAINPSGSLGEQVFSLSIIKYQPQSPVSLEISILFQFTSAASFQWFNKQNVKLCMPHWIILGYFCTVSYRSFLIPKNVKTLNYWFLHLEKPFLYSLFKTVLSIGLSYFCQ